MGRVKNYYFNEINGLDEDGNPLPGQDQPTEEEYAAGVDPAGQDAWENQDFAQDGEFENQEGDERL